MQTFPCKQEVLSQHITWYNMIQLSITWSQNTSIPCGSSVCVQTSDLSCSSSWSQWWQLVFSCQAPCSSVVLQGRHAENPPLLCIGVLGTPAGEYHSPGGSYGLRCSFWCINWGYIKDIKSPEEINLQVHPAFPQLPYVSHSISNYP